MYRLENKTMEGSGKLNFTNVEGLAGTSKSKSVRDSITSQRMQQSLYQVDVKLLIIVCISTIFKIAV